MKRTITIAASLLLGASVFGQTTVYEESPEVKYFVSSNGVFFNNPLPNATGGYFVPKDSLVSAIFGISIMAFGEDVNGQLKGGYAKFGESDFFPGAMDSSYSDTSYVFNLWSIDKEDIDYHIAHWNDQGYTLPGTIASWPGNGDVSIGESLNLAPYYDYNQDNFYDPMSGDYPLIEGDHALYTIVNDHENVHPFGSDPAGIEVHMMFYYYNTPDPVLAKTMFVQTTVFNRGTQTLYDFHFGHFVDFDLGNPNDDFIGTSVNDQLAFVYNGDDFDQDFAGGPGYGVDPPAVGILALDGNMSSHIALSSETDLATPINCYNTLRGLLPDGSPLLDNNNQQTLYAFNGMGTGWNEVTEGNAPGDRKTVIGYEGTTLAPFSSFQFTNAIIYGHHTGTGSDFPGVDSLFDNAAHIQEWYNATVAVEEQTAQPELLLYPNPANDVLHTQGWNSGTFRVIGLDGKIALSGNFDAAAIDISRLNTGYYLLELESGKQVTRQAFVKK